MTLPALIGGSVDGSDVPRIQSGSTPWIVDRSAPDDRQLILKFATLTGDGISHSLDRIEVDESETQVRIAVIQTILLPRANYSWVTFPEYVEVTLRQPLGDRPLLHEPIASHFADLQPSAPGEWSG